MKSAKKCMVVMLTLSLLALTACSQSPVIVMNEAKTMKINEGEAAPWSGWLLTDGAMVELLECCEGRLD